jgi:D-arabinose 1-dehydrogenase-like Zn-dependent alcohol dehydrogenase
MRAEVWHGQRDVRVDDVPQLPIEASTDPDVCIATPGLCCFDLHLDEVLAPVTGEGRVFGHQPMGFVEEVAQEVTEAGAW